jgi:hypothetical protein
VAVVAGGPWFSQFTGSFADGGDTILDFSSGWQVGPELQPCNFDHGLPVRG